MYSIYKKEPKWHNKTPKWHTKNREHVWERYYFLYSSVIIEIKTYICIFPPYFSPHKSRPTQKNQLICYCVPGLLGFEPGTQLWQFSLEYLVRAPALAVQPRIFGQCP